MSNKPKEKKFKFHIHEYLVVIIMLLVACLLTYVIPAGEYSTLMNEAGKEVIDPNGSILLKILPFLLLRSST